VDRIFCNGQRSRASSNEVQIVGVVARTSNHGMVSLMDQDCISIVNGDYGIALPVTAVEPLVSKSPQPIHSVVVNLVEIDFDRWVVNVMFVRRINWTSCRPVYIPQPQLSDPPENRAA